MSFSSIILVIKNMSFSSIILVIKKHVFQQYYFSD